jgi:Icc protein
MGLGDRGRTAGIVVSEALWLGDRAQRHIHQIVQKVEGKVTYQTAMSTAFPAAKAGEGPGPRPLKVPAEQLRHVLGIREVAVTPTHPLALTDITLA